VRLAGDFGIKLSNDVREILKGPTQVAMATKTLLTRPHSSTLGSKTANINVKNLPV